MATTQNTYTGDGTTVLFSFTFPYILSDDVKVSLDGVLTTEYTLANATTIEFTTAPSTGVAIRVFRQTSDDDIKHVFYPGSAIRARDLNDNYVQNLYVTQEANFNVDTANTTADTAKEQSDTALTNSAAAVVTANAASVLSITSDANSTAAVQTANASDALATQSATDATNAVATANTASTDATTALANSREDDGAGGFTSAIDRANTAVTTANTALTNSREADGNGGFTSAIAKATTASTDAAQAIATANAASSAASNAVAYTLVADVASISASPSNDDYIELGDSTGVESFTPLSGVPAGFVGVAGLSVRLRYASATTSWVWLNYFANDPEDRYLTVSTPVVIGDATNGSGQITLNCENNSHGVVIKGPPHSAAANYTFTLPNDAGTNGFVLKTNGSGTTSWGGADVIFDTTPQLGGDLDVNDNDLVNGDTKFRVGNSRLDLYFGAGSDQHLGMAQSGDLTVYNTTNTQRGIAFYGGSVNNFLTIKPPATFTTTTYYLPASDGSASQVLTTDGSGNMSWDSIAGRSVFVGFERTTNSQLRVVYSTETDTTTYSSKAYTYKGVAHNFLGDNSLLHTSGTQTGQPKLEFNTNGHLILSI